MEFLDFEININNKLLCLNFLAVLPPTKDYLPEEQFRIRINQNGYCFAQVIQFRRMYLDEIINLGYNYLDAGLSEEEYITYLRDKYKDRKWWRKDNEKSEVAMMVVWFKKVNQLNLFDNNEIYTNENTIHRSSE